MPYWVVLHVVRGAYTCTFDDQHAPKEGREGTTEGDGYQVTARPGEVLMVPAGARHALTFTPGTMADGLHIHFGLYHDLDVFSVYRVPSVITGDTAARATSDLTATLARRDNASLEGLAARHADAYRFLAQILAVSCRRPDPEHRLATLGRLQDALALIEKRPAPLPRVAELAERCALSRNRFSELFKAALGISPKQYLEQRRMRRAMSLLVHGDASIADIAERLDFCDAYHFSKRFKALTGLSPRHYRAHVRRSLPDQA
ncbi:helix-turn-helix domain-containing protein [Onishia taeanensis]